jgi:hypothetical protein
MLIGISEERRFLERHKRKWEITLKWILKTQRKVWSGYIWLRIRIVVRGRGKILQVS